MKRLIGYDSDSQQHSPETLRHYLYGGHVADYMKHLMEEDEEKYKTHFARFIKEGVTADGVSMSPNVLVGTLVYRGVSEYYIVMPIIIGIVCWGARFICVLCPFQLEQMYKDAHAKIREDPSFTKKAPREDIKKKR